MLNCWPISLKNVNKIRFGWKYWACLHDRNKYFTVGRYVLCLRCVELLNVKAFTLTVIFCFRWTDPWRWRKKGSKQGIGSYLPSRKRRRAEVYPGRVWRCRGWWATWWSPSKGTAWAPRAAGSALLMRSTATTPWVTTCTRTVTSTPRLTSGRRPPGLPRPPLCTTTTCPPSPASASLAPLTAWWARVQTNMTHF